MIPWTWSYRLLYATLQVLGPKPRYSKRGLLIAESSLRSASNIGSFTTRRLLKFKKDGNDVMLLCFQMIDSLFLKPTLTATNTMRTLNSRRYHYVPLFFSLAVINYSALFIYERHILVQRTNSRTPSGKNKLRGYLEI